MVPEDTQKETKYRQVKKKNQKQNWDISYVTQLRAMCEIKILKCFVNVLALRTVNKILIYPASLSLVMYITINDKKIIYIK